ncbi:MAG: DegT/DnrJ/EryC1/StrS family aminotransferase, partial [Gemmataceae bacterium]
LRQYGWSTKYNTTRPGGRNSRLDELQAAALRTMLPLLKGWNDRRKQIAAIYEQHLSGLDLLIPRYKGSNDVVHLYVIRSHKRDALKEKLAAAAIGADIHYPVPDYLQEGFEITPKPTLPVTESWCRETLTLPCFPELTDAEVIQIATAVRTAVESN